MFTVDDVPGPGPVTGMSVDGPIATDIDTWVGTSVAEAPISDALARMFVIRIVREPPLGGASIGTPDQVIELFPLKWPSQTFGRFAADLVVYTLAADPKAARPNTKC